MKPPPFRYERPATLVEALALLAEHGDEARPLAGGQSLVPMLNLRLAAPAIVVDLNGLAGRDSFAADGQSPEGAPSPDGRPLDGVAIARGRLVVGALTRQRCLERAPEALGIGALADGLPLVGHVATRNRGTVGGSIAHADPAAELPLALLALGGSVVVAGPDGRREIAADDLFAGFLTTTLRPGELLVEVRFPLSPDRNPPGGPAHPEQNERGGPAPPDRDERGGPPLPERNDRGEPAPPERNEPGGPAGRDAAGSALVEVAQRHGDFPLAAVAVSLHLDGDRAITAARIAVGAVADRPLLLPDAADALLAGASAEEAGWIAGTLVDPAGSLHAPADYQRHLVSVLVARAVTRARARAGPTDGRSGPEPQDLGTDRPAKPGRSVPRIERPAASEGGSKGTVGNGRPTVVNGRPVSLAGVPDRRLLSDFLRHDVGLRGTHVGCEHGVCGACTIRLDGVAVRSCLLLAHQAEGAVIQTVEGLAANDDARTLHPLQEAFRRHFALQCGFCTAGILMAAAERLDETAAGAAPPDREEIRRLLSGHLCRCTGYEPIVAAIADAWGLHLPPETRRGGLHLPPETRRGGLHLPPPTTQAVREDPGS